MGTFEDREAAFGEGFDMATESHKEAISILKDRIAELEAALRPFGNAYRFTQKLGSMRREYEASMTCTGEFTVADLHRAADLTADK